MTERQFAMHWLRDVCEYDSTRSACQMAVDGGLKGLPLAACGGEEML
ncbi:hypothetical protein [Paenibacillus sp. CCS19]|nr:hypothetical protein [Paenibacillus cellulosilyticus]